MENNIMNFIRPDYDVDYEFGTLRNDHDDPSAIDGDPLVLW
jgi:hypothetical protein